MSNTAIQVDHLSKQYRIGSLQQGGSTYKSLREELTKAIRAPIRRAGRLLRGEPYGAAELDETIWALKDVSFEIEHGEAVGIIGPNGAGKTTLLKILSRITEPTEGRAVLHGRVGSLLEVGTGFHPELTGRENIYLNGAILGMGQAEIERKYGDIVSFSGVEKFVETPVKHYSSGMRVRLAFSVAAHLDPEILLIDEVLSVGDAEFQEKCLGKMDELAGGGRTVLFVSHDMGAVSQLCTRALLLSQGRCQSDGKPTDVIAAYLGPDNDAAGTVQFKNDDRRRAQITSMSVVSPDARPITVWPHTKPFELLIRYRVADWPRESYLCVDIFNEKGVRLIWSSDVDSADELSNRRAPGTYEARVTIPGMILSPGRYSFTAAVYSPRMGGPPTDVREGAVGLEIADGGSLLSDLGIKPHAATMVPLKWATARLDAEGS